MRAHRLALVELRRITSGPLLRLAVVAILLIPTLYAGLYLLANKDPYGKLNGVPAALVVEDRGATLSDGSKTNQGDAIAKHLQESKTFQWHRVDRADAESGIRDERFAFAIVIPGSFTEDLRSSAGSTPRQATLEHLSNDANGYLARTIASTLVQHTTAAIASDVSKHSATTMLDGFATIRDKTNDAVTGSDTLHKGLVTMHGKSKELSNGLTKLATGADQAADGVGKLATGADKLSEGTKKLVTGSEALANGTQQLATGAPKVAEGVRKIADKAPALISGATKAADGLAAASDGATKLAAGTHRYRTAVDTGSARIRAKLAEAGLSQQQIDAALEQLTPIRDGVVQIDDGAQKLAGSLSKGATSAGALKDGAGQFSTGVKQLVTGAEAVATGSDKAAKGAKQLADGIRKLDTGAATLATGAHRAADGTSTLARSTHTASDGASALPDAVNKAATGAGDLKAGLAKGVESIPHSSPEQRKAAAEVIGSPVKVNRTNQASAGSYGEGMAPFFLSLSLWIGAYVLFLLIRPLSHRALAAGQPAWRVALSGWMTPALLGIIQAMAAYVVAVLALGFHVSRPLAVLPFLALITMTFVSILHALSARFGAVGKFLGLVLMVVQLVSAGGTFPWQTLPSGLQILHQILPMTYAIDGLRHLMYGGQGPVLLRDVLVLLLFLAIGMAGSIGAAVHARLWTPNRVKPDLVL